MRNQGVFGGGFDRAALGDRHQRQQRHCANDESDWLPEATPMSELLLGRRSVARVVQLVRVDRRCGVCFFGVIAAEKVVVVEASR